MTVRPSEPVSCQKLSEDKDIQKMIDIMEEKCMPSLILCPIGRKYCQGTFMVYRSTDFPDEIPGLFLELDHVVIFY